MGNAYYKRDAANRNNYQRWLKENATVKANKIAVASKTLETLSSIKGPALLLGHKEITIMEPKVDHFPELISKKREDLVLGDLTDNQLANAVFLFGNSRPDIQDVIDGKAKMPIVYLTAAKERIRWLTRQLGEQQKEIDEQQRMMRLHSNVLTAANNHIISLETELTQKQNEIETQFKRENITLEIVKQNGLMPHLREVLHREGLIDNGELLGETGRYASTSQRPALSRTRPSKLNNEVV